MYIYTYVQYYMYVQYIRSDLAVNSLQRRAPCVVQARKVVLVLVAGHHTLAQRVGLRVGHAVRRPGGAAQQLPVKASAPIVRKASLSWSPANVMFFRMQTW